MIKKLKSAYFSLYVQPPVFQYTVHGDHSGYALVTNAIVAILLEYIIFQIEIPCKDSMAYQVYGDNGVFPCSFCPPGWCREKFSRLGER